MLKELKNLTLIVCKIIIVIIIMILDYKGIEFLVPYKIIIKLKQIISVLMYLRIKISKPIEFIYQKKVSKITWNYF